MTPTTPTTPTRTLEEIDSLAVSRMTPGYSPDEQIQILLELNADLARHLRAVKGEEVREERREDWRGKCEVTSVNGWATVVFKPDANRSNWKRLHTTGRWFGRGETDVNDFYFQDEQSARAALNKAPEPPGANPYFSFSQKTKTTNAAVAQAKTSDAPADLRKRVEEFANEIVRVGSLNGTAAAVLGLCFDGEPSGIWERRGSFEAANNDKNKIVAALTEKILSLLPATPAPTAEVPLDREELGKVAYEAYCNGCESQFPWERQSERGKELYRIAASAIADRVRRERLDVDRIKTGLANKLRGVTRWYSRNIAPGIAENYLQVCGEPFTLPSRADAQAKGARIYEAVVAMAQRAVDKAMNIEPPKESK